ncbi:hypothetical protein ACFQWB_06800 [Paenibacillus thermoaerophilus]|uniref:Uncharacterized protein n=1 Tax=Paenibacillus thermoaerophilus TaxID=1215385 RepID=A0ABW2V4B7_9BACL|nr:hypothetical protein [Paenibacillus thermoaerophilus]
MADKSHSKQQLEAARAQSKADRTGQGKEQASAMQSEADQAAIDKHGL